MTAIILASMQSNKSSEREISIVLSNDSHNLGLDAPTQLVKPNKIISQIATQEQCLNYEKTLLVWARVIPFLRAQHISNDIFQIP
jgi:hypothetical protein